MRHSGAAYLRGSTCGCLHRRHRLTGQARREPTGATGRQEAGHDSGDGAVESPCRWPGQGTGLMGFFDRLQVRAKTLFGTAALAAGLLACLPSQAAFAQGAVKSVHKDWQIRCDTPPGAKSEQSALIQSVVAEDRANVGLTVIVLKTADAKSRLMRVEAPLGVLLLSGFGLLFVFVVFGFV